MSNRVSRTQALAHLASIAAKSKTEDSDVLFFKGGTYKGEWNPNTIANSLPDNTQTDNIFLVSENGSYYGRSLLVGELVRYLGEVDPMLVYSKYLPIDFFLSMLEESDAPTGSGLGFVFGGEFDATPTVTPNTAEFNHLIDCAISAGTLVPSAAQFGATASNLSKIDVGTQMEFRVVWPDTSAGFFMFLMHNSSEINPYLATGDEDATVYGIGASMGTLFLLMRDGGSLSQNPLIGATVTAGDVVRIGYRPGAATIYFYNETQGDSYIAESTISAFGSEVTIPVNLGVFAMSAVPLAFDFADDNPLQQNTYSFTLPSEPDGKTYLVANATPDSIFDSKLLKNGDFMLFYDEASKAIVTRLYTDEEVNALAQAAITQEIEVGGSIYNAIQSAFNV